MTYNLRPRSKIGRDPSIKKTTRFKYPYRTKSCTDTTPTSHQFTISFFISFLSSTGVACLLVRYIDGMPQHRPKNEIQGRFTDWE